MRVITGQNRKAPLFVPVEDVEPDAGRAGFVPKRDLSDAFKYR